MKNTKPAMKYIIIESKADYMLQKKKSVNLNTQQQKLCKVKQNKTRVGGGIRIGHQ